MTSLPIADLYAAFTTAFLGVGVVVAGLAWFHTTSVSTVSKAPTSTFGWLQQGFSRLLSSAEDEYNPQDPVTAAVLVHSEPQRRRVVVSSASNRGNGEARAASDALSNLLAMYEQAGEQCSEMKEDLAEIKEDLAETKEDISELQAGQVDHSRKIAINSLKLNMTEDKVNKLKQKNNVLHKKLEDNDKKVQELEKKADGLEEKGKEHDKCFYIYSVTFIGLLLYLSCHHD